MLGSDLLGALRSILKPTPEAAPAAQPVVAHCSGLEALARIDAASGARGVSGRVGAGMALGGLRVTLLDPKGRLDDTVPLVAVRPRPRHGEGVQLQPRTPQEAVDLMLVARLVAENALVPVVVVVPEVLRRAIGAVALYEAEVLREVVGEAQDAIHSSGPAQEMLFGSQRRRLLRQFDPLRPALVGTHHDATAKPLVEVGRALYFGDPARALVAGAMAQVGAFSGRPLAELCQAGAGNTVVVASGPLAAAAECVAGPSLRVLSVVSAGCDLSAALAGASRVFVLCQDPTDALARQVLPHFPKAAVVACPGELAPADVLALVAHKGPAPRWLGVAPLQDAERPKRQAVVGWVQRHYPAVTSAALVGSGGEPAEGSFAVEVLGTFAEELVAGLAAIGVEAHAWVRRDAWSQQAWTQLAVGCSLAQGRALQPRAQLQCQGPALGPVLAALRADGLIDFEDRKLLGAFPSLSEQALTQPATPFQAQAAPEMVPLAVRALVRTDEVWDSLPRFWNQIGRLYQEGRVQRLNADPHLAFGLVPPLTSTFRPITGSTLPAFDPEHCTGCGRCWAACPEGALGPVALSARQVVDAGMSGAAAQGNNVSALRPVLSKLAKAVDKVYRERSGLSTAGDALELALAAVIGAMPEARRTAAEQAASGVIAAIGDLPLARTPALYDGIDGQLLSLSIDADVCKRCGLCAAVCEPEAMRVQDADMVGRTTTQHVRRLWEQLPDTQGSVIADAAKHPEIGPVAATLLARTCLFDVHGGDPAEPGSGDKLALRTVLAMAEGVLQPRLQRHLQELDGVAAQLDAAIHELLSAGLPTHDLDALARALPSDLPGADLGQIFGKLQAKMNPVDTGQLGVLIDLLGAVRGLREGIASGPSGLGRARVGLALTDGPGTEWARAFPHNPFLVPVVQGPQVDPEQVMGLAESLVQRVVEERGLLRTAVATAKGGLPPKHLGWSELSAVERGVAPALVMVVHERADLALAPLLRSQLPIKVLVLCDADPTRPALDVASLAMAAPGAYAAQCSLAVLDQLGVALKAAFAHDGPAILRIHAPSPTRHGFEADATVARALAAVSSRVFPLYRYDPAADGVFGSCIQLDGNPAIGQPAPLSVADYLSAEGRFAGLSTEQVAAASALRERSWRTLLELAGVVTPFTEAVRSQAEHDLSQAHEAELAALQRSHSEQVAALKAGFEAEVTGRLRSSLLRLAGYGEGRPE